MSGIKRHFSSVRHQGHDAAASKRNRLTNNSSFRPLSCGRRNTQDEIHGLIDLCPVSTLIIDTPQFQRLRGIKQLGNTETVYMNANHTRFEHSIGVAYLADKMAGRIMDRQPILGCTKKDVLCIKLAGLLHDLGHGPFSHVFEVFVKKALPAYLAADPSRRTLYKNYPSLPEGWQHEATSLMMIDALLEGLGLAIDWDRLDEPLQQIEGHIDGVDPRAMRVYGVSGLTDKEAILTSRDFIFIKECIFGGPLEGQPELIGRPHAHQEWMYDIVSNRRSGLDVDKIDYFARDERRAKGEAGKIDEGMILNPVVAWAKCTEPTTCKRCCQQPKASNQDNTHHGMHLMICYEGKMVERCMAFFEKRDDLHTTVYSHNTSIAAGSMLTDILCLADPFVPIPVGKNSASPTGTLPISRAMRDPSAFLFLKDPIIDIISSRMDIPGLRPAQDLLQRYQRRDIYKCVASKYLNMVGSANHRSIWDHSEAEITQAIVSAAQTSATSEQHGMTNSNKDERKNALTEDDFFVVKVTIHHGCKDKNPVSRIHFLEKSYDQDEFGVMPTSIHSLPEAVKIDETDYPFPSIFQKNVIHVISKTGSKRKCVSDAFQKWWGNMSSVAAKLPFDDTTAVSSLSNTMSNNANQISSKNGSMFALSSQSEARILTQDTDDDDDDDNDILETDGGIAASSPPRMLTQDSDDEDGMDFDDDQDLRDRDSYLIASITRTKQTSSRTILSSNELIAESTG